MARLKRSRLMEGLEGDADSCVVVVRKLFGAEDRVDATVTVHNLVQLPRGSDRTGSNR